MSASPQPYLFISYASVDHARVLPLTRTLEAAGVRVWRDQEAIPGGSIYGPEIVAGIEGCAALVVMCSAAALSSPNVRQEIALAWKYRRPYLPLLLEQVSIPRDVEYWLEGAQWIEVLDRAERVWLSAVVAAITRLDPAVIAPLAPPRLAAAPSASAISVGSSTHAGDEGAAAAPAIRRTLTLLGRDPELAVLRALLEFAEAGQGQLAFLVGEPGIGKTRLTTELRRAGAGGRLAHAVELLL